MKLDETILASIAMFIILILTLLDGMYREYILLLIQNTPFHRVVGLLYLF